LVLLLLAAGALVSVVAASGNDRPEVTIVALVERTGERGGGGVVEIRRDGPTDAPLAVNYVTLYGTSTRNVDFVHPGAGTPAGSTGNVHTAVIPAGASSTQLTFVPRDDLVPEQPETIVVTVAHNDERYSRGDPSEATVTIVDDEPSGVPAAPTTLSATRVAPDRVLLSWEDESTDETAFVVERRAPDADEAVELARVGTDRTVLVDTDAPTPEAGGEDWTYRVRSVNATGESSTTEEVEATAGAETAGLRHVSVADEGGRFKGWPANGGLWAWGDELVVLYEDGALRPSDRSHAIAFHDRIGVEQARSTDGGETWVVEPEPIVKPGPPGFPRDGNDGPEVRDLAAPVDFSQPGFALYVQMSDKDYGVSYWYYSTDRARSWSGPYRLPTFGYATVNARTDYVINGPSDVQLTLSGTNRTNDEEGSHPFVVRSTDGGLTWEPVSRVGPDPTIQSSTVRLHDTTLVSVGRNGVVYASDNNGVTWGRRSTLDTARGPYGLARLDDGRLLAVYGYRSAPFGVRARISSDGGRSWSAEAVLRGDGGSFDLGYPRAVVRADGSVVVVYYHNTDSQAERTIDATILDPSAVFGPGPSPEPAPQAVSPVLDAPTGLEQIGGAAASVTVAFTPPDGGPAIEGYQFSTDDGTTWCGPVPAVDVVTLTLRSDPACSGAPLARNQSYRVRMRTVTSGGAGASSGSVVVTTMPSAPTALVGFRSATTSVTIAFADVTGSAPVDHEYSTDGSSWCPAVPAGARNRVTVAGVSNPTCTGAALAPRTAYSVRLRAVNGDRPWNEGPASAPFAAVTVPRSPQNLSRTGAETTSLTIAFSNPAGPAPLTNHFVSTDAGTTWCPLAPVDLGSPVVIARATNATCTGGPLTANTTYRVRVAAATAAGRGNASTTLAATTRPGPPTAVVGTAGTRSVALSWEAPTTAGGLAVTDYVVQHSRDGTTWTTFVEPVSATPNAVVTGLLTGTRYAFRVAARTAAGQSAFASNAPTTYVPR
jgi:hypothetical protein